MDDGLIEVGVVVAVGEGPHGGVAVEVFITVDVVEPGALAALDDDGVF